MEDKIAHLQMIQGVVNRMSVNSFLLKGWTVVLVGALFALAAAQTKILFVYVAFSPSFAFWILDGHFLRQERLFRALYDHVRRLPEDAIDFSMNTGPMAAHVRSWGAVIISKTLLMFHGVIIGSILVVMLIIVTVQGR